jgi:uncharacterized protein (TIGR03083 family)
VTYTADITIGSMSRALTEAANDFASMLRRVSDPSRSAIGSWTVGETTAHVARSAEYFLEAAKAEATPVALDDVADHNAEFLSDNPERDPRILADRFENNELALTTYVGSLDGDPAVEVFDEVVVPMSTLLAVELGEVLVHGYDIAGASGLDWPIGSQHAALAVGGLLPILPHMINPTKAAGFDARIGFRIRGGIEATLVFDDGVLQIEAADGPSVDCRLTVDPTTYLLLSFNRITSTIPTLQGKVVAWGRRPWLAVKMASLFKTI